MAKEFRCTLAIDVFITAENQDEADSKLADMNIEFIDPDTDELLQSDLIDWDITQIGEIEEDEIEDDD
jgi:hypothetical protein